jgi:hypothetical protein
MPIDTDDGQRGSERIWGLVVAVEKTGSCGIFAMSACLLMVPVRLIGCSWLFHDVLLHGKTQCR